MVLEMEKLKLPKLKSFVRIDGMKYETESQMLAFLFPTIMVSSLR